MLDARPDETIGVLKFTIGHPNELSKALAVELPHRHFNPWLL